MSEPRRLVRVPVIPPGVVPIPTDPADLRETPEEATARAEQAQASRLRMWEPRVPVRFHDADVRLLDSDQCGDRVRAWLDRPVRNLILHSEHTGVGKTYAAYAVGNHMVRLERRWAAAWSMPTFNEALRPGNDDTALGVACECDLLILDDLGTERVSEWSFERLQMVLDSRSANHKRTVVTTNLSGPEVQGRYDERVVDRLTDDAWVLKFEGTSRRKPAPW